MSGFEEDAKEFEDRLRMIRRACLESRREGVNVEGDPEEFLAVIAAILEYQKRFRRLVTLVGELPADELGAAVLRVLNGTATEGEPT